MVSEVPELLPARMLNAFVFCPRLFHLEWVGSEWRENEHTLAGSRDHRIVDQEQGVLPDAEELGEDSFQVRSVLLSSEEEGLVARLDLLECASGRVVPVDYKHGRAPEEGGLWPSDRIQIGVQALLLRGEGYVCERGMVYYAGSHRREEQRIDEWLEIEVRRTAEEARRVAADPTPPPPLEESKRCLGCSLVGICLPDEHNYLRATTGIEEVRRLYPARDDALPVFVQANGARVGKRSDEIEIWERTRGKRRVRLLDISHLALFGNVQVTSGARAALLGRGIPIAHFSYGGWFYGLTTGLGPRNAALRLHQYRACQEARWSIALAQGVVSRKIRNCRTLVRRNGKDQKATLAELERCSKEAQRARSLESLLGIEGQAARAYFGAFSALLHPPGGLAEASFEFSGRNRRPPRDPVNALLSLAYSILAKDWTITCLTVALDPYLGFYHRPRFGRPALALDLMEEFRPLIADSVVLTLVNTGEILPEDFVTRGRGVALTDEGRKKFFLAYERRMAQLVTHPAFGYQISYRRLLEVQARLFGRHLTGELDAYKGFVTR